MYKKVFSAFLVVAVSLFSQTSEAQIITTLAGTQLGYGGDGDLAVYCAMSLPAAMTTDRHGNIYICDQANNRIRKIDGYGIIKTIAGTGAEGQSGDGGPAIKARIAAPGGITIDSIDNVYISDTRNNRIRKIDTAGIITTVVGDGTGGFIDDTDALHAELKRPLGLKFDKKGNLFFADLFNNRIRKVDAVTGKVSTLCGTGVGASSGDGGPATAAAINLPYDVVIDNAGNVYFSDHGGQCIRKIDTAGIVTKFAGIGIAGFGGDQGVPHNSQVNNPAAMGIDPNGNIYFADTYNNRVRKIDTAGVISTLAGTGERGSAGDGGLAGDAELDFPESIAVDSAGNVFVGQYNGIIRYIFVNETGDNNIHIFPNPCRGTANILLESPYEEIATIQIVDMMGRITATVFGPTNRIVSLRVEAGGFYVVYAVTKHGRFTAKLSAMQY